MVSFNKLTKEQQEEFKKYMAGKNGKPVIIDTSHKDKAKKKNYNQSETRLIY